jgi:DNA polymerase V
VLSANDGCIVSRSEEVKAMGVPMGEPYFRVRGLLASNGVAVCSGNLALYRLISGKVMRLLSRCAGVMEIYSIDEAFLNLPSSVVPDAERYAARIAEATDRFVGVPVSVGLSSTKTLSKLASDIAKKRGKRVMKLDGRNAADVLDVTPAEDIWGIGRGGAAFLRGWGARTAGDFVRKDPLWVKKWMSIRGVMTQYELKGQPCIPVAVRNAPPKSVQASRTWGVVLETMDELEGALADNVFSAGAQLRRSRMAAGAVSVFIRHGYRHRGEFGYFAEDTRLGAPASSDFELLAAARRLLRSIYRPGYAYTQGGVILYELSDAGYRQRTLWDGDTDERRIRLERLSKTVDAINETLGGRAVFPAALAAKEKKWLQKSAFAPVKR